MSFIERLVNRTLANNTTVSIKPAMTPEAVPEILQAPPKQFSSSSLTYSNQSSTANLKTPKIALAEKEAEPLPHLVTKESEKKEPQEKVSTKMASEPAKFKELDMVYNKALPAKSEPTQVTNKKKSFLSNYQSNTTKSPSSSKSPVTKNGVPTISPQVLKENTTKSLTSSKVENSVKIEPNVKPQPQEEPSQNAVKKTREQSPSEEKQIIKTEKTEQELQVMISKPQISTSITSEDHKKEETKTGKTVSKPLSPQIVTEISPSPRIPLKERIENQVAPTEPTVTIHIGRIEVHTATPQKQITRSRMPVLSLKEYLKQREEENR